MNFKSRRESQVDLREEEAWVDLIYHHWLENGEAGMKAGMREPLVTEWILVCNLQGIKRPTTTM